MRSGNSSAATAWTNLTDKLLDRGRDYLKRVSVLPLVYRHPRITRCDRRALK